MMVISVRIDYEIYAEVSALVKTIDDFFKGYLPLKAEPKQDELYVTNEQKAEPLLYISKEGVTVDYGCVCEDC